MNLETNISTHNSLTLPDFFFTQEQEKEHTLNNNKQIKKNQYFHEKKVHSKNIMFKEGLIKGRQRK